MMTPSLFGDEGAATPGSNSRTESRPNDNALLGHNAAPARRTAPPTSHEAARRIEGIAGALCQRVLAFIRECGEHGATDAECQTALGMLTQTQTPRRNALAKAGAVVNSGKRRPTPSNRKAIVWVVREHARQNAKAGEGVRP